METNTNVQARVRRIGRLRRGVSLAEVAVSAALVGVMLVATLNAVGAVFKTRLAARQRQQGDALARELLSEVLQASHRDPQGGGTFGLEAGESGSTRVAFDDGDDYDGWSESPPKDQAGNALPNAAGWTRRVDVIRVEPDSPLTSTTSETGLKLITVTATSPSGEQTVLQAFRSSGGAVEMIPPIDRTYVTSVRGQVQLGGGGLSATGQSAVVNHAEDQ